MRQSLVLLILIVLFGAILTIFGKFAFHKLPPVDNKPPIELPKITEPRVTVIDPVRGATNAKVTLVEFGDYYCTHCQQIEPAIKEVLAAYPRDVKLVWKDLPNDGLHPQASKAAAAARCAGEAGKYWEYHDALLESVANDPLVSFADLAVKLGISRDSFNTCLESDKMNPVIQMVLYEAQALSLDGSPFFFLNGKPFSGTTADDFKSAIDALLK